MQTERRSFDLNKYFGSSNRLVFNASYLLEEHFTSVALEQGQRPFHERINIYTLAIDKDGDLSDPVQGKLKDKLRDDTDTYALEKIALLRHFEPWARKPYSQYALWISPPSGEIGYSESRFILSIPNSDTLEVTNIAICGFQTGKQCIDIFRDIDKFCVEHPNIQTRDDLRASPLFIDVPNNENYADFFARYIDLPLVWESIKNGKAVESIEWARNVAQEVVGMHLEKLSQSRSDFDRIMVGASMEKYSAELGAVIQYIGSCGKSNSALLESKGAFNKLFVAKGDKNWEYKHGSCRICRQDKSEVGPCSICKTCEADFD